MLLDFKQKYIYINGQDFDKNMKNHILGHIWPLFPKFWENQIFSEKSGSVTFQPLSITNFMLKIRKFL